MERRAFMTSVVGGAMLAAGGPDLSAQEKAAAGAPGFYLWRQYILRNGPQPGRLADYLQNAAIPALNRLGHQPIGAFEAVAGVATPTLFLLVPSASADALAALDAGLARDDAYVRAAGAYADAPADDPPYIRQESSLLAAFPTVPRIEVPAATAQKGPRLFELRIYESTTEKAHRAKVRMFEEMGEIAIFRKVGLTPVFFASTVVGPRMPNLAYLLVHDNMAAREKSWQAFSASPDWKKLAATPGYSNAEIVSNITTVFLRPAAYSQI